MRPGGQEYSPLPLCGLGSIVRVSGPLSGRPANSVPGRASPRAGLPAQAQARDTGRSSPGTKWTGPGRVRAGPKNRLLGGPPGRGLHGQL